MTDTPKVDSEGFLGDTKDRSYADLLEYFTRFAEPEIRQLMVDCNLPLGGRILDAGCGAGATTRWLAEAVGPGGLAVGLDLSLPHCRAAHPRAPWIVQADLRHPPLRSGVFDCVWTMNALNHLESPVDGCRALTEVLRPGGRLIAVQGHFLPEMIFAWDDRLERAVTDACCRAYLDQYGRDSAELTDQRRLIGTLWDAGLRDVRASTVVIERQYPLDPATRDYFQRVVFEGHWGPWLEPHLEPDAWRHLQRLCDPASPDHCLDRPDFHHLQTLTAVVGTVA